MADEKLQRALTACPLDCPDACSLDVALDGEGRVVALDGNLANPTTGGYICGKVRHQFTHRLDPARRVLTPLIRKGHKGRGRFREATWDEAMDLLVEKFGQVCEKYGPEAVAPVRYGGSNGALTDGATDARFFRRLGATRVARTVCAAPTTSAAQAMYGRMPGICYEDYEMSKLIVVWGANPQASGIHLVPYIRRAQKNGAKLVVIDPRRSRFAKQADLHLALRPGTDLPLALSLIRWIVAQGLENTEFLEEHAEGFGPLIAQSKAWSFERTAEVCGLDAAAIESFARMYVEESPAALRCGWGLERNRNGGSAVCAVLALPAIAGKFGVRGGGYTLSNNGAWELAPSIDDPPAKARVLNQNHLGRALTGDLKLDPPIALLFVYNANPWATFPDQERIERGLRKRGLYTVVYDQVLTDTARFADLVLPATTFLEHHDLSRGYGTFALQEIRPVIEPLGEARPNYEVFGELLQRLGLSDRPEGDPEALLRNVLRRHPAARSALAKHEALVPAFGPRPIQFVDVFPRTPDKKIHLFPTELDEETPEGLYAYRPDPGTSQFPLALISPATEKTISSTLGELFDGVVPLAMHPDDAATRGIDEGDMVRVFNKLGEVHTPVTLTTDMRPGVVLLPKGLWAKHTKNARTSNALVPDSLTDFAGGACFNDARVEVATLDS